MTKKHKRLTIEVLRAYPGFENFSDEKAEETIKDLEKLSILLYELYHKELQEKTAQGKALMDPDIEPKSD